MTGISATAVINTKKFVLNKYGRARWDAVVGAFDLDDTRRLYDRKIKDKEWIDYPLVVDMLRGVKQVLRETDDEILVTLGKHNSEANLRVTQRIIMKIASVSFVLKLAAKLWKGRVRDGGTLTIQKQQKHHVKALLSDFPDPQSEWFEYLIGWFTRTIELSGGRAVKVNLLKAAEKPHQTSEYECTWT